MIDSDIHSRLIQQKENDTKTTNDPDLWLHWKSLYDLYVESQTLTTVISLVKIMMAGVILFLSVWNVTLVRATAKTILALLILAQLKLFVSVVGQFFACALCRFFRSPLPKKAVFFEPR